MRSNATFPFHAPGACGNKIRRAALVLAPVLVCSSARCIGRGEVQSDTEVRSLLTEAARLSGQVESLRDRMVVLVRPALATWKSGDSTSAKINFDEALDLVDGFPPQEHFADFYRQSIAEARMEVGDVEGADRTLGRIKDNSQRSEAFRTVGLLQARRGDFESAVLKAPAIQDAGNRDEYLQSISKMQQEASDLQDSYDAEEPLDADGSCADISSADAINVPDDKTLCLAYWGGQL